MALGCSELIDEIKSALGRDTDTELITDTRVCRWLNKAQEEIAEQCPGLTVLDMKNTTSVDFTVSLSFAMSEFTSSLSDITTSNRVCHIYGAAYIDGNESQHLQFMPQDDFDSDYLDPTSTDFAQGKPKYYTRRGNNIEVFPICLTANCDKDFRLDGSVYPIDFTAADSTALSSLERADDLLIAYAIFKAWTYIGKAEPAQLWLAKFNGLLEEYKRKNDVLHEWNANIYGVY